MSTPSSYVDFSKLGINNREVLARELKYLIRRQFEDLVSQSLPSTGIYSFVDAESSGFVDVRVHLRIPDATPVVEQVEFTRRATELARQLLSQLVDAGVDAEIALRFN